MQHRLRYDCRCTGRRPRMTIRTKTHPQHGAANCQAPPAPLIYIIMGVSGCGKSTVGALLAQELKCPFYDADSYHPEANIRKMKAGILLTDDDRWPWLKRLRDILAVHIAKSQPAVMACSALKPAYRQLLCSAADMAHHHHHQQQQQESQQRQQQQQREPQQQSDPTVTQPAQQATPSVVTASAGQPGQHNMSAGSSPVVFILLNPPRALLQAWLGVRAAAGAHFMPLSLLDSQLQQLEVPDPSELYMCFGSVPSINHTYSSSAAGVSGSHAAVGGSNVSAAAANREGLLSYPSSREIVNTILARSNASALV